MNKKEIGQELSKHINSKGSITTSLGELIIPSRTRIGQGGNGAVYLAKINEKEIAIKFLIAESDKKLKRFKSEFFNTNYVRNELENIVNMIHYGELELSDGIVVPYIIMTHYSSNLKEYKKQKNEIEKDDFKIKWTL